MLGDKLLDSLILCYEYLLFIYVGRLGAIAGGGRVSGIVGLINRTKLGEDERDSWNGGIRNAVISCWILSYGSREMEDKK